MTDIPPGTGGLADALAGFGAGLAAGVATVAETPELGESTARQLVWRDGGRRLYRYQRCGDGGTTPAPPLLIVYAMVNRPSVLDLRPGRSLVRHLLARQLDVFLLEWGDPRRTDAALGLEDYVVGRLGDAIDRVVAESGARAVHLLGVCQGGVFALCRAAYAPERIASVTTTVTPVDFHTPGDRLSNLVRHLDLSLVEGTMARVPGALLNQVFLSLKPAALSNQKYLDLVERLCDPEAIGDFLAMERWIADSPDQPVRVFAEFVRRLYQDNALMAGTLTLAGRRIDLGQIPVPVLNVYARDDHIVPPAASRALSRLIPTERYRELAIPGGHIGLYVGRRALRIVPEAVAGFVHAHDSGMRHRV